MHVVKVGHGASTVARSLLYLYGSNTMPMSIFPENIQKRIRGLFTRNFAIFLVCVGIAAIFWLLTKLSNNYTSDIQIPVVYSNLPKDKVLQRELPGKLTLYVHGSGWDLLRHYLNLSSSAVVIDAKEFAGNGNMPTNSYRNVFSQQLQDKFEVQRVIPAEINFDYFEKRSKTLPIKLQAAIDINAQYGLTDTIELTPDSVTATGPAPLVDSLPWIYTDTLVLQDVSQTTTGTVALRNPPDANIELSINQVKYHIPVEQFTETSIRVPIKMVDVEQNAILLTKEAQVAFQVPLSRIREYEQTWLHLHFEVAADPHHVAPCHSLVPLRLATGLSAFFFGIASNLTAPVQAVFWPLPDPLAVSLAGTLGYVPAYASLAVLYLVAGGILVWLYVVER
jgi:hypothetical protein